MNAIATDRNAVDRHILALATCPGHANVSSTYWYLEATPVLLRRIARDTENAHTGGLHDRTRSPSRAFLREHLSCACNASRHTVASYADSFMLLVGFAAGRLGVRPCEIAVEHLTPQLILDFLDHLEEERGNSVGTRNVRLAAIKSFFRYLEYRVAALDLARQVHAIPLKRYDEPMVGHLDRDEVRALLEAPDCDARGAAGPGNAASRLYRRTAGIRTDRDPGR